MGETELDGQEAEDEPVLPPVSTFLVAGWAKWMMFLFAPPLTALFAWIGWDIVQVRLAGTGWSNVWLFAFTLATLGGLVLLFACGLILVRRARLTFNHQGMVVRGIFGARTIAWEQVEGYRWSGGNLFAYPAEDRWPMNLSHFENQGLLHAWLYCHVPNLDAMERGREAHEIKWDNRLGLSDEEKAARLGVLRRVVKSINWIAYAAAGLGALNALFLADRLVQLVAAAVLIPVPVALVCLAFIHRDQVRLDYREGSLYPEGATGLLASSIALGLMSLLDHHNVLGERLQQYTILLAAVGAGLWLHVEWERIRAQRRWPLIALHVASIVFLAGFWAGGSLYQLNKNADVSEPAWDSTKVTAMRTSREKTGTSYHVTVAPWSASAEPVELDVSGATYDSLGVGASVEISVRSGALEIPWVDELRPKKALR